MQDTTGTAYSNFLSSCENLAELAAEFRDAAEVFAVGVDSALVLRPAAALAADCIAFRGVEMAWTTDAQRTAAATALHYACLDLGDVLRSLRSSEMKLATGPAHSTAWTALVWLDPVAARLGAESQLEYRVAA